MYGHVWGTSVPESSSYTMLLDGLHASSSSENIPATLHVEGLPGQVVNTEDSELVGTKFGNVWAAGNRDTSPFQGNNDGEGRRRVYINGGARASNLLRSFGAFRISELDAFVPLIPIPVFYIRVETTPDDVYYLGQMSDVFHVQMASFTPGQEITIGSDTYLIFPAVRKRREVDGNEESWNMGVAYRRIT